MYKKLIIFIFMLILSLPVYAGINGEALAFDATNNIWRVINMTAEGLIVASSSVSIATAPPFINLSAPVGAMAGYVSASDMFVPLMCDATGNLMVTVSGSSGSLPSGTSGDILIYGTTWEVLNKGTADQVLTMNSGGLLPEWKADGSSTALHNDLGSIDGGEAGYYGHLTAAEMAVVDNTSNTNTGDETVTTIKTKLGAASTSTDGYLTSTNWNTFNGKVDNPMTTQGDVIYGGTSGAQTRLAKGTATQVLTMNAGATAPEWAAASGGFENPMTTAGDRLAIGAATQVLTSDGTTASWAAASGGFENPMTTAGDVILGGTSGAAGRLAIGAATQVLTSDGTTASWAAASGGFDNPMTTAGDIILGGSSGAAGRLAIGASTYVLTSNGTTASWAAAGGGSVSQTEVVEFPAGSFDYPNGATHEIAPLDYYDSPYTRTYFQAFDDSTNNSLIISHTFKPGFNSANDLIFEFEGFSETQTTGAIGIGIYYRKWGSTTSIDATGTAYSAVSSDVPATAKYKHIITKAISVYGYSAGDTIFARITRDVGNAGDDLSGDWNLVMFRLKYTRSE